MDLFGYIYKVNLYKTILFKCKKMVLNYYLYNEN